MFDQLNAAPPSSAATDECVICGEGGCDAEMFNPETGEHGPTHAECGIAAGWDIS